MRRHHDLLADGALEAEYAAQPLTNLLKLDATLVNVGYLDDLKSINGLSLIFSRRSIAGSVIGGIAETQELIDYCEETAR
jgi:alcohol dehydrogenase (NADP+)